ncbi:hypothetical protein MP228_003146 [Amoeboaphelidium protococcarum]|nr:hypothetical protein MP228_003146 [Amoeboaphelidium protococcarum]
MDQIKLQYMISFKNLPDLVLLTIMQYLNRSSRDRLNYIMLDKRVHQVCKYYLTEVVILTRQLQVEQLVDFMKRLSDSSHIIDKYIHFHAPIQCLVMKNIAPPLSVDSRLQIWFELFQLLGDLKQIDIVFAQQCDLYFESQILLHKVQYQVEALDNFESFLLRQMKCGNVQNLSWLKRVTHNQACFDLDPPGPSDTLDYLVVGHNKISDQLLLRVRRRSVKYCLYPN